MRVKVIMASHLKAELLVGVLLGMGMAPDSVVVGASFVWPKRADKVMFNSSEVRGMV